MDEETLCADCNAGLEICEYCHLPIAEDGDKVHTAEGAPMHLNCFCEIKYDCVEDGRD